MSAFPDSNSAFKVERHGSGWAIYRGRGPFHHGFNIGHLSECSAELAASIENALNRSAVSPAYFQSRVLDWTLHTFGVEDAGDVTMRNHRFLEESLELVQALGCTASEAHQLVDYVFGRPLGEPAQEVGGVMVTLAALCAARGLDMDQAGADELARVWQNVEKIRAKHAAKPKHSPLPISIPMPPAEEQDGYDALLGVVIALKRACDDGLIVNPPGMHSDAVGVLSDAANDALTAKPAAPAPSEAVEADACGYCGLDVGHDARCQGLAEERTWSRPQTEPAPSTQIAIKDHADFIAEPAPDHIPDAGKMVEPALAVGGEVAGPFGWFITSNDPGYRHQETFTRSPVMKELVEHSYSGAVDATPLWDHQPAPQGDAGDAIKEVIADMALATPRASGVVPQELVFTWREKLLAAITAQAGKEGGA